MHLGHKIDDFRKRLWTKKQETKKSLCPSRQGTVKRITRRQIEGYRLEA